MNRLTRIYGLKDRHGLHELTGRMMLYPVGIPTCWIICTCSTMDKPTTTILRLGVITLQNAKVKDCDRHPPQYARVQIGKPGKVSLVTRKHDSDTREAGGASVIVGDGESPLHGEGTQFNRFARVDYLTSMR
jgi:hypothetical protein